VLLNSSQARLLLLHSPECFPLTLPFSFVHRTMLCLTRPRTVHTLARIRIARTLSGSSVEYFMLIGAGFGNRKSDWDDLSCFIICPGGRLAPLKKSMNRDWLYS
jgi:hypothetical protein